MSNTGKWTSWNANIEHEYNHLYKPTTEKEICEIVKNAKTVRMIGTGKSSADIVAGTETLISYENYNQVLSINETNNLVTVQPGVRLKEFLQVLEKNDLAFPALPDIDDITVGGAVATGTHGTGKTAQTLSEYIYSVHLVNATGNIEIIDETDDRFHAVKMSLGLLGIFTEITFQCIPKKFLNVVERPMEDSEWLARYETMLQENDFLRILWLPHTDHGYVITGNYTDPQNRIRIKEGPWYYKYRRKMSKFLYGLSIKKPARTAWANKIIYTLFFSNRQQKFGSLYESTVTKSRGSTLELAEWTVDINHFEDLFADLKKALDSRDNHAFAHIPMDIRFLKAEKNWLSNAYERDIVTVGCVTRSAENADDYEAFDLVEKIFLEYNGRPHWAKRFQAGRKEMEKLYTKWNDFVNLRRKMDENGKFLNSYLKRLFE